MKKQISVLMIFSVMAAPVMAQEANKQPLKLNTDDKVQTLLTENPMKFEHQVFDVKQDKPMQLAELSQKEMKETEGTWVANAIGGIAGMYGAGYGYLAGGGRDPYKFAGAAFLGGVGGAFSPVNGIRSAAATAGGAFTTSAIGSRFSGRYF